MPTYDPLGPPLHLPDRQWNTDDEGLDPEEEDETDAEEAAETEEDAT